MAEQRDAPARERRAQRGVREQAVDAEVHRYTLERIGGVASRPGPDFPLAGPLDLLCVSPCTHLWTPREMQAVFEEDRHVVGCCHLSGLLLTVATKLRGPYGSSQTEDPNLIMCAPRHDEYTWFILVLVSPTVAPYPPSTVLHL